MKYERIELRQDHYFSREVILFKAEAPEVKVTWVFKGIIGTYCPGPGKYDLHPCTPEGVGVLWGPNYPLNWWVVRKTLSNEGHYFNEKCERSVYAQLVGLMMEEVYYYYGKSFTIVVEKIKIDKSIILTPTYDTLGFVLACNASYAFKHFVHPPKGGEYEEKVVSGVHIQPSIHKIEELLR